MKHSVLLLALVCTMIGLNCYGQCGNSFLIPATVSNPQAIAVTPDGKYIALGVASAGTYGPEIFSLANGVISGGTFTAQPPAMIGSATPLIFSPKGALLVNPADTTAIPATIAVYQVNNGVLSGGAVLLTQRGASAAAFTPDEKYMAVTIPNLNQVEVFANNAGTLTSTGNYTLPLGSNSPITLQLTPDGNYLATINSSNDLTVFTVNNGVLGTPSTFNLPFGVSGVFNIQFSPNGQQIAALSGQTVTIMPVNNGIIATTQAVTYNLPSAFNKPQSIAYSPDGKLLVISNSGTSDITIYSVAGNSLQGPTMYTMPAGTSANGPAIFTPDGSYLLTYFTNTKNYILVVPSSCITPSSSNDASMQEGILNELIGYLLTCIQNLEEEGLS